METSGYFKVSMVVDTNATAKQHPALQKDSHLQARPETTGPEAPHFSPTTASASTFLPIPPLPPFQSLFLTLTQMRGKNWEENGLFWLWWKFWNSSSIKIVITGIFGAISRDKCFHKQESQGKKMSMSVPGTTKCSQIWSITRRLDLLYPPGAFPSQTQESSTHHRSLPKGLWGHWLKYIHCLVLKTDEITQCNKDKNKKRNIQIDYRDHPKCNTAFSFNSFQKIMLLVSLILSTPWTSRCYSADNFKVKVKPG